MSAPRFVAPSERDWQQAAHGDLCAVICGVVPGTSLDALLVALHRRDDAEVLRLAGPHAPQLMARQTHYYPAGRETSPDGGGVPLVALLRRVPCPGCGAPVGHGCLLPGIDQRGPALAWHETRLLAYYRLRGWPLGHEPRRLAGLIANPPSKCPACGEPATVNLLAQVVCTNESCGEYVLMEPVTLAPAGSTVLVLHDDHEQGYEVSLHASPEGLYGAVLARIEGLAKSGAYDSDEAELFAALKAKDGRKALDEHERIDPALSAGWVAGVDRSD